MWIKKHYGEEYKRWLQLAIDEDIKTELEGMDEAAIEDSFYRNLAFGTGGLRGTIGAGTNRMNIYVVAKASQGLANYLIASSSAGSSSATGQGGSEQAGEAETDKPAVSVVIGYDSRIKYDVFAKVSAAVSVANGITVRFWPELTPVPTVRYAVRDLNASAGVMITASHNPSKYGSPPN